jgi:SAM-dependent MidA family methyltransferase
MLLVFYIEDSCIGKSIVGNEVLDAFPIKNISLLTLFLG